jgi:hypothetical protein
MSKKVVEKSAIPRLAALIHDNIKELTGKDVSSLAIEPFAKVFLQLEAEYRENENTFTSYPNNAFLASLVLLVLEDEESKKPHTLLLEELAPFVAEHDLSDFAHFRVPELPMNEKKALFLSQHVFSEMLSDFDRDLKRDLPEYGSADNKQEVLLVQPSEQITLPINLPDELLDEDLPELRQGVMKVKDD